MRSVYKHFVVLILTLVYSSGASGMSFHVHFCRGEFHSIEFAFDLNSTGCGCQKKAKPESCCKDVTGQFSIENDHSSGFGYSIPQCSISVCDACVFGNAIILSGSEEIAYRQPADDPPEDSGLPIYLLVRNLRH